MTNFILAPNTHQAIRERIAQGKVPIDIHDKEQMQLLEQVLNTYQKSNRKIFSLGNNLGFFGLFILSLKATLAFLGL